VSKRIPGELPLPDRCRCVAFDAVGTLIRPEPGVAEVYHTVGSRYGSRLGVDEIRKRFHQVLSARQAELTSSEQGEREFWVRVVADVIGPVEDPGACFEELYEHFGRPECWTCMPGAAETLDQLRERGLVIAVASNFDARLHAVLDGLASLREIRHRVISSEIGWRKPSPRFFQTLCETVGCAPQEILMVGDDLENDILAAQRCGMHALHVKGIMHHLGGAGT
jgi:putative hydrolase of the HAD superfamily